ncbi:MAG: hypothetical protein LUQ65_06205 [Candidatus Helarchaeota archaeon]|nr:hypothetical protein [Candidatus Helarchaeota archaeon]
MGALKIVGGIFALVAGVLVLLVPLAILLDLPIFDPTMMAALYGGIHAIEPMATYVNLILAILAIVGGILGLAGKKAGGVLALIAAIIWILGMIILAYIDPTFLILTTYSAFVLWIGI